MNSLFRHEVIEHRQQAWLGSITLLRPVPLTVLTTLALCIVVGVISYLILGEYTKKARVMGFLVPEHGIIRIIPPQSGTLIERLVREGQAVQAGDALFVISMERVSRVGDTQASVEQSLASRQRSLEESRREQGTLATQQIRALERRASDLRAELDQINREIGLHTQRQVLAEATLARFRDLLSANYVSAAQIQQKEEDLIDIKARVATAQRSRLVAQRDLASVEDELRQLPTRTRVQTEEIDRNIAMVAQEAAENSARQQLLIRAPRAGTVTGVIADLGQTVTPAMAIATLVPADDRLQAQLYAPSNAIGFVQPGQSVVLRYQPFPYQKFGHSFGHIVAVSRTALSLNDLQTLPLGGNTLQAGEPLYRITVDLDRETVLAYGQEQRLQPGTQVDADVLQDRRKLIEWVFEPMLSLTGKL